MQRKPRYKQVKYECFRCKKLIRRKKARIGVKMYCSHLCAAKESYYVCKIRKIWRSDQAKLMNALNKNQEKSC